MTDLLAPDTAADEPARPGTDAELGALLTAVAAGDRGALADLYDATSAAAFGLALRLTANRAAAEEVVREAFLNVWRDARRYDPGAAPVRAWILGHLRRCVLDRGGLAGLREALTRVHETGGPA
ncbi:sigma factor [Microbacterium sp. NPDC006705]|uniref:sigma factor n=1 Tax=Microbacterium TaxID=33882 RepID=UPI00249F2AEB|nr:MULTISPECIES: sigma factor [Microbacterium]WHE35711.1 sigma factor [Microbacterium sp. BDGP8]WRK16875.1 sigma factor [Microbacterium plantarum]